MNEKVTSKRILVLLLILIMISGYLNVGGISRNSGVVNAQGFATDTDCGEIVSTENNGEGSEVENTYSSENFEVKFNLDNLWDTGYNATITVTNTSDNIIENWCLTFPLNETINDIWNASIYETYEDFYIIKNAGWNQDIAVDGSVSFGITVYEAFSEFPDYYTIIGNQIETNGEDYTIDYKITDDWGEGYKAEVTITNNKITTIEDWRLSFMYGDNLITQIWNANIISNVDGRYELGCENYNQNIEPGGSVTFGFMVEPGCSAKLMENMTLKEYTVVGSDYDEQPDDTEQDFDNKTERHAIIFGMIEEDNSNELNISMMASLDIEKYKIYLSLNNGNFEMVSEIEGCEYIYNIMPDCLMMEIYALGYGKNNEVIETNHIFVEYIDGEYIVIFPDADGDGLEDVYEIYYGSDESLIDTDGDGLNDFYEVYTSFTCSTLMDSDDNGIFDGEEDYDGDGLSVIEECNKGTDPINSDTDCDGLADGDEANVYCTNPLVADCDEDGLIDGDEIELRLNPNNDDTDNDGVLDCDEKFQQTFTHKVENEECVIDEVTIELFGTGNIQNNTYVKSIMEEDTLCAGVVGLVGEPFDIVTESDFEEAIITFKIDIDKLDDTIIFDNLLFLWYDEINEEFVELETTTIESLGWVRVNTTHFSKYMIVDRERWYDAWDTKLSYEGNEISDYNELYTMLMVESSLSMGYADPITYIKTASSDGIRYDKDCFRIGFVNNYINNMKENEKISICTFNLGVEYSSKFSNDSDFLKKQISRIDSNDTYVTINYSLLCAMGRFENDDIVYDEHTARRIIMITKPHYEVEDYYMIRRELLRWGVRLDVIMLGEEGNYEELSDLCNETGGHFYILQDVGELSRLYYNIYYDKNFDTTDSDGDMLYDVIEKEGIRLKNGRIIYTNPNDEDTDGDHLLDGEEIIPEMVFSATSFSLKKSSYRYYYDWSSDPTQIDTDGDGINDDVDNRPFDIGYYSEEAGKNVVGELTIVASTYSPIGHTYLLYESYINDSLWLSGLTGGYNIYQNKDGNFSYENVDAGNVDLKKGSLVTIAASSIAAGNFGGAIIESNIENGDLDSAGIYYNREVMGEIKKHNEGKELYVNNAALSKEISENELSELIKYHKSRNYYNILDNNCNIIATGAWNYAFGIDEFDVTIFPRELKEQIKKKTGAHSVSLQKLWGIK